MKKILIGTIVGTIIFFAYQGIMWNMVHKGFASYTPNQDAILNNLNQNLTQDGVYFLPWVDPADPDMKKKHEAQMEQNMGRPWAMVFYHTKMEYTGAYVAKGVLYSFLACLIVCLVLYNGMFSSFGSRFLVSMCFALFTLVQGVLDDMNWWSYPWNFVKPEVIDLILGWGITSLWLAWFVKRKALV
jgi:hypothetical protein